MDLDLSLVRRVRPAVERRTRRTPMRLSARLGVRIGAPVGLKLECEQVTGSFKVRGALAAQAIDLDPRPWVTASAGNHGLAVAYACRDARTPPVVFVPRSSPQVKRAALRSLGADLRIVDADGYDAAESAARHFVSTHEARFVSAFDHPAVMAGNGGTLAMEILEAIPDLGTVLVPVGGGGLLAGVGCVLRALRPAVRIVGVQSEATPAMQRSFATGTPLLQHAGNATLCDGLEGGVGALAFEFVRRWVDDVVLVPEAAVAAAMWWLWEEERVRVEGAGAVGVAACLHGATSCVGRVCIVLSGCNVDDDTWDRVKAPRTPPRHPRPS